MIDGVRFRVRIGVLWRDVPIEHGSWGRICDLFRRWHRILTRLQSLAAEADELQLPVARAARVKLDGKGPRKRLRTGLRRRTTRNARTCFCADAWDTPRCERRSRTRRDTAGIVNSRARAHKDTPAED
ncbi:hypothetical protein GCM10027168_73190 [Streptomyces capparidis]